MIDKQDLQEFKEIYKRHYNRNLSDEDAVNISTSLVNLFQAIAKPVPNEGNQK